MAYETKSRVLPDPERYRIIIRESNGDKRLIYTGRLLHDVSEKLGKKTGEFADSVPAPRNLTATGKFDYILLDWSSVLHEGLIGYKIYRDGELIATSSTTSYEDSDVIEDVNYTYFIVAYDIYGDESPPSNFATARIGEDLQPPENLTGSVGDREVTINWDAPSSGPDPDYYRIYQNGTLVKDNISGTTGTISSGLQNFQPYPFTVRSVKGTEESTDSQVIILTPAVVSSGEVWTIQRLSGEVSYFNDVYNNQFNIVDGSYSLSEARVIVRLSDNDVVIGTKDGLVKRLSPDLSSVRWTATVGSTDIEYMCVDGQDSIFGAHNSGFDFFIVNSSGFINTNTSTSVYDASQIMGICVDEDNVFLFCTGAGSTYTKVKLDKFANSVDTYTHPDGSANDYDPIAIGEYIYFLKNQGTNDTVISRMPKVDLSINTHFFNISNKDISRFRFNLAGDLLLAVNDSNQTEVIKYVWDEISYIYSDSFTVPYSNANEVSILLNNEEFVIGFSGDLRAVLCSDVEGNLSKLDEFQGGRSIAHPGVWSYVKVLEDKGTGSILAQR